MRLVQDLLPPSNLILAGSAWALVLGRPYEHSARRQCSHKRALPYAMASPPFGDTPFLSRTSNTASRLSMDLQLSPQERGKAMMLGAASQAYNTMFLSPRFNSSLSPTT